MLELYAHLALLLAADRSTIQTQTQLQGASTTA